MGNRKVSKSLRWNADGSSKGIKTYGKHKLDEVANKANSSEEWETEKCQKSLRWNDDRSSKGIKT
jgi:hypothetical protein